MATYKGDSSRVASRPERRAHVYHDMSPEAEAEQVSSLRGCRNISSFVQPGAVVKAGVLTCAFARHICSQSLRSVFRRVVVSCFLSSFVYTYRSLVVV